MNAIQKTFFNMAKNHLTSKIEQLENFSTYQNEKSDYGDSLIQVQHDLERTLEEIRFTINELEFTVNILEELERAGGNKDA